jgi:hypothetical protein
MSEEFKVTDSGVEYKEHVFKRNNGEKHVVRVFQSVDPARLTDEDETFEEYKIRRGVIAYIDKQKKKGNTVWTPYPFGTATKGMVYNEKNREVIKALGEQWEKSQYESKGVPFVDAPNKEIKTEEV